MRGRKGVVSKGDLIAPIRFVVLKLIDLLLPLRTLVEHVPKITIVLSLPLKQKKTVHSGNDMFGSLVQWFSCWVRGPIGVLEWVVEGPQQKED